MAFPPYTKTFHNFSYPAIEPSRPELSTAGKVILITGGGSGVGPHITHAFATSGASKIAILGRTESSLLITAKDVESKHPGVKVLTFVADITDKTAVYTAFEAMKKAFGPIDIFVSNAAAMSQPGPITTADADEWFSAFETNVKGNLILSQAFIANASEKPILIHVTTGGIHVPAVPGGLSSYAASKLAAVKLMEYVAFENPSIRLMFVHPGVIDTEMNKKSTAAGLVLPYDDGELFDFGPEVDDMLILV
jgi:NAD(P)-dependent dehydrogenase (short-subunit alcohol dehydrogenase family)